MKNKLFIVACLIGSNLCIAKTFAFEPGKIPSVTLAQAVSICEKWAGNSIIKVFNPETARLMGDDKPDSGEWHFEQRQKDGRFFAISVEFPEGICYVYDGVKPVEAFKFDGTKVVFTEDKK